MTLVSKRYEIVKAGIEDMSIADIVVNSGFTRNQILTYGTDELASILEIDQYVANIIRDAAKG